ncbi:MAG: hypothetical protein ACXW28_02565, partial [Thermoanaerobaculia bacterium]
LACVLLLRGCRSGGSYVAGAFVLAVAAGFRPQNLLVGLPPSLIATWCRVRSTRSVVQPLLAAAVGAVTLAVAFGGAALATGGWDKYWRSLSEHRAYIEAVDSFRNPGRPGLQRLFDDFFVRPYRMAPVNTAVSALAAIAVLGGFLGKRKPIAVALIAFGPFCILGWLMLDRFSASRFSIGWAPLIALACADGSAIVAHLLSAALGRPRVRAIAQIAIPTCLVVTMAVWALPALAITRGTDSPPAQAIRWIRSSLPADAHLYVHETMVPYSDLLLDGVRRESFGGDRPPIWPDDRNAWVLREGAMNAVNARHFSYPRGRLWNIARRRFFEVSVALQCPRVRFGDGWYGEERSGARSFRWMGTRASVFLPPAEGNSAELALHCYLPLDAVSGPPVVSIVLDGILLDRFAATDRSVERRYAVTSRGDRPRELAIEVDRAANRMKQGLGSDSRDLGLRLDAITWSGTSNDCE